MKKLKIVMLAMMICLLGLSNDRAANTMAAERQKAPVAVKATANAEPAKAEAVKPVERPATPNTVVNVKATWKGHDGAEKVVSRTLELKPGQEAGVTISIPEEECPATQAVAAKDAEIADLRAQVEELKKQLASSEERVKTTGEKKEAGEAISGVKSGAAAEVARAVAEKKPVPDKVQTIEGKAIRGETDQVDAMINGGYYWTNDAPDGHGNYLSGRARYRPLYYSGVLGSDKDLGVGISAYGSMVDGEAGVKHDAYHKRTWSVGPTAKLYGRGWDTNFDLGFGKVNEYGKGYDETQTVFNPFIWHSDYTRRLRGETWFPKIEGGASMVVPISSGKRDMRTGDLYLNQWVYDHRLGKDTNVSYGVNAGLGYDKGNDYNYWSLGPAVSLQYKNQDVLTLSLGYKEKLGKTGDLWQVGGSINVGNVVKLIKASQITAPTEEDLKAGP